MPILTNEYLNYYPKLPPILYHYCSVNTFISVLQNENLWLSDAEKTNDYTEMKWLFSRIKEVIDQAVEMYKVDFPTEILQKAKMIACEISDDLLLKKAPIVKNAKNFFVCMSESQDLLSQWRAYGNDGEGIAIGFNTELLRGFLKDSDYIFTKVIYDSSETLKFLHTAIDEPLKWAIESSIDRKTQEIDEKELMMNVSLLIYSIWQEGFVYKNHTFSEEREWRLFRKLQTDNYCDSDGVDDYGYAGFLEGFFRDNVKYLGDFTRSELKYRSTEDDIRVYFELGFTKCKKDIIKEIIIGPKCKINPIDIKLMLAQNGYIEDFFSNTINIKKSECPYI